MHVLVCDDDAALRFVVRRWLTTTLGCVVSESSDGVEALDALSHKHVDLLLLDLGLPRLAGMEVVEAIRTSGTHADLPIVVLSNERRLDVIRQVVGLGVSDYLLKPLRAVAVRERIRPLLVRARQQRRRSVATARHLGSDTTALLVDGDANFRHAFVSVAESYGAIVTAESGADAVAAFRAAPAELVFVGTDLGMVGLDAMMRKMRDVAAVPPLFVCASGLDAEAALAAGFDAVVVRSFQPEVLRGGLAPFVRHVGPLAQLQDAAPGFEHSVDTSVSQVLGMMADLAVHLLDGEPVLPAAGLISTVTIEAGPFVVHVGLAMSAGDAAALAARMMGCPTSALEDEMIGSTLGEIANMVTGRVDAWLKGRGLASKASLPEIRALAPEDGAPLPPGEGLLRGYGLEAVSGAVVIRLQVTRP